MDTFRLNNGMTIEFSPAEKWSGQLFVKTPEKSGEESLYQIAADHLIEHCFAGGFEDSETRNGYVRHQLPSMTEEKGSIGALKSLMKTAYALRHPMLENVSAEKEAIVEEWSMCSTAPEKFKFWGGFMHAVTPDKWDMIDETITPEKGMAFINRQADYTRHFTDDELQHHLLATYGAKSRPAWPGTTHITKTRSTMFSSSSIVAIDVPGLMAIPGITPRLRSSSMAISGAWVDSG